MKLYLAYRDGRELSRIVVLQNNITLDVISETSVPFLALVHISPMNAKTLQTSLPKLSLADPPKVSAL